MDFLNVLLELCIYSGIIFAATMLIKKCFKNKMSPFLHFAIWGLFLLRLLIPVTLEAPMHIFTYQTPAAPVIEKFGNATATGSSLEPEVPATALSEQTGRQEPTESPSQVSIQPAANIVPVSDPVRLTTPQIVLVVWLGGAGMGFAYVAVLVFLLLRKVRLKSAPAPVYLLELLGEVRAELGIKTNLRLKCLYEYGTPALLFPRTILIPMDALAFMNDEQIRHCLRHECMHLKRGDHVMSLLLTLLNAVYWFNPFVWPAFHEMRKDIETACDSAVIKRIGPSSRRSYAELILSLSGRTPHMQIALGMAQGRKNAERRIKGVYMAYRTKRSAKLVSVVLAAVLLLCCFTTACQPTPEIPPVVNRAKGISPEMIAEPLPEGQIKELDAPKHWEETLYQQNNRIEIAADVDIHIPDNLSNTPVVKLEQAPFSQERMAELIQYFVGDSKLYKPLPMTKFEGLIQLKKLQHGEGSFGEYTADMRKLMAEKLRGLIEQAPDTAEKVYTDLTLTLPHKSEYMNVLESYGVDFSKPQGEKYVNVFAETGEEFEPETLASTYDSTAGIASRFSFVYPGSILSVSDMKYLKELHQGFRFIIEAFSETENEYFNDLYGIIDNITETPDQALATAQKALDDLGVVDMKLATIEKGVWAPRQPQEWDEFSGDISKAQGGYYISFVRTADQLVGYRRNYGGMTAGDLPQYTPPFRVEAAEIFVSNGKILKFDWMSMAKEVETVASNTNLLPFSEITRRLADYLSYNYPIYKGPNGQTIKDAIYIQITDVQLRASQIPAKDDPYKVWMVPAWLFSLKIFYTDQSGNETINPEYPCEINALDGGIIIPIKK